MRSLGKSGKKPIEETGAVRPRKAKLERVSSAGNRKKTREKTLRKTGIDILGDAPWGTHFCLFYHTRRDLIDILVPYFKAGLENNEFCMWVTSEPLNAEDAKRSLSRAVKNLDSHIKKGQIEILDYSDWYTKTGDFEADRVLQGWVQKHGQAIKNGFDGLRLTGNTFWLEKKDWREFTDYEAVINSIIGKYKILAVCTYSLERCGASEILDVEHNHQFSLIKWKGDWKILESSDRNQIETRLAEQTMIAEALERSKKEWVNTFNAISDWVCMVDLKGRILRTNRIGEEFTGVPLDEIIDQSCCKLVHGSEKQIPGCPLKKMLETGQSEAVELKVPDSDRWLMVTVDPVTDEEGNILAAVHITRDITDRKKAEEALKKAENEKATILNIMSELVAYQDAEHRVVWANRAACESTGLTAEKLLGCYCYEIWQGRNKPCAHCPVEKAWKTGRLEIGEIHSPDGRVWSVRANPVKNQADNVIGVVEITLDITECKKAEQALKKERDKAQQYFDVAAVILVAIDSEQRVGLINKKGCNILGYKEEEILGKNWFDNFLPEKVRKEIKEFFYKFLAGDDGPEYYEYPVLTKNGEERLIAWHNTILRDDKRNVIAALNSGTDITERKKAEEALRDSRNMLQTVLDSIPATLFWKDCDSIYLGGNRNFLEGAGIKSSEELVGKSDYDLPWEKEQADSFREDDRRVMESGFPEYGIIEHYLRSDGTHAWARTNKVPLRDAEGNVTGVLGTSEDITERKKAEEKLLEYQEQLKSLASELTLAEESERRRISEGLHDQISQSLAGSKIELDALLHSVSPKDHSQVLKEVSDSLGKTIDDMRSLTFDLSFPILYELGFEAAVAAWLVDQVENRYGINTEFEEDGQLKPLDDDVRVLLFRDIRELLINVISHAKAKNVKVSIRKVGREILVSIEDDGIGFDTKKESTAVGKGGFGLFSIRQRLGQLGGHLEIESAPGCGTKATLVAPLKQERENRRGKNEH